MIRRKSRSERSNLIHREKQDRRQKGEKRKANVRERLQIARTL